MKKIRVAYKYTSIYALVDDDDYEFLNKFTWYTRSCNSKLYINTNFNGNSIGMHCLLLKDVPNGCTIDHINGDPLDNRRENLRIATYAQQQFNRSKPINNTTGYKGVSYVERRKDFRAYINVNGKQIHLGYHKTARLAAIAHNKGAKKHHGEFAYLNVIEAPVVESN